MTRNLDNYATVELNTMLVTLDDFVSDSDSVTSLELWELLAGSKSGAKLLLFNEITK